MQTEPKAETLDRMSTLLNRRAVVLGLGAATSGCGFILYPGRRGRNGGQIDIPVLIIDLLWLIPGLLPGAICLIVDFTTGCIYRGGGRAQTSSPPSPHQSAVTLVDVVIDGEVVAKGEVQPNRQASLVWNRPVDEAMVRERARLSVRTMSGATAESSLRTLI